MVGLGKKLRASTLMETLVATIIILAAFVIASLVLNNTFRNLMTNDRFDLDNRIRFIEYRYAHNQIELPYTEDFSRFEIYIAKERVEAIDFLLIEITDKENQKTEIIQKIDENKK